MTVDFATYCNPKDVDRLYDNFLDHVGSNNYTFDNVHIIHQRCEPRGDFMGLATQHTIKDEDYDGILKRAGINPDNAEADDYTHGWGAQHYWKHHCVNHLTALSKSTADYVVLCDADCYMKSQPENKSWVNEGVELLRTNSNFLVISPGAGEGRARMTTNMSQQMFLCDRQRLLDIDFDMAFTGFREGGPMQEYYFMLEGRIGRYMEHFHKWRWILSDEWRYWHKQWH